MSSETVGLRILLSRSRLKDNLFLCLKHSNSLGDIPYYHDQGVIIKAAYFCLSSDQVILAIPRARPLEIVCEDKLALFTTPCLDYNVRYSSQGTSFWINSIPIKEQFTCWRIEISKSSFLNVENHPRFGLGTSERLLLSVNIRSCIILLCRLKCLAGQLIQH